MFCNRYPPLHSAAERGHVNVVRVLKEYNFNLNQQDWRCRTPIYYANDLETCRFLLENGADPNEGRLYKSVLVGNTEVTRLLLSHGADPRRIGEDEYRSTPIADLAIENGHVEILSMLIQHGVIVEDPANQVNDDFDREDPLPTSLNYLLWSKNYNREVKLSICRILVNRSKTDKSINEYIIRSLAKRIENCELLVEAGMEPHSELFWAMDDAIKEGKKSVCRLLVNNGVDPFVVYEHVKHHGQKWYRENAPSAFHDAARKTRRKHLRILEYFSKIWQERFASSNAIRSGDGKHSDGDFLIHFLCRDKYVSLNAIKRVVENYGQVNKLMLTNDTDGFRPFLVAAVSDASLDVIFYLLKHHPIAALGQVLETQSSAA